jgi:hypothetical protein
MNLLAWKNTTATRGSVLIPIPNTQLKVPEMIRSRYKNLKQTQPQLWRDTKYADGLITELLPNDVISQNIKWCRCVRVHVLVLVLALAPSLRWLLFCTSTSVEPESRPRQASTPQSTG